MWARRRATVGLGVDFMSTPPSIVRTRAQARGGSRDLIGAWLSTLLLPAVLGAMPLLQALFDALRYDVEESFGAGLAVLVPFLFLFSSSPRLRSCSVSGHIDAAGMPA